MTIAEKLQLIAKNVQKNFDAGKKAEYDEFWDNYLQNGKRKNFNCAFAGYGWNHDNLKQNHAEKLKPTTAYMMFGYADNITDLSDIHEWVDFSDCTNAQYLFYNATKLAKVGKLDLRNTTSAGNVFFPCANLKEVEEIYITSKTTSGNNFCSNTSALEKMIFKEGSVINFSGIDLHWAKNLSLESIRSILKALSSNGNGKSITFYTGHQTLIESDAECSAYASAATSAGWTIAYN